MDNLRIELTQHPKKKPGKGDKLGFGTVFTDHMMLMEYDRGIGWHDARIVPYGNISLSPASTVLHYAQETFEGMKAYRSTDGRVLLFRRGELQAPQPFQRAPVHPRAGRGLLRGKPERAGHDR